MRMQTVTMGMPATVEVVDQTVLPGDIQEVFSYFDYIDSIFSTYKKDSEISKLNRGELYKNTCSRIVKEVLKLSEQTKKQTEGFFNIERNGYIDPSGLVKGYAIQKGAQMLSQKGYKNFCVEIAGDIAVYGKNKDSKKWSIGIRNPFDIGKIVKVVYLENTGVATSGTYLRGQHIYNPFNAQQIHDIASITVIAPSVYDADRFATAAFAMGKKGITFLEKLDNIEGYMIDTQKNATMTSGFEKYVSCE